MRLVLATLAACATLFCQAQFTADIRVNQEGYFEFSEKIISVKTDTGGSYSLKSADLSETFLTGEMSAPAWWTYSEENIATIDISGFNTPGDYVVEVDGLGILTFSA